MTAPVSFNPKSQGYIAFGPSSNCTLALCNPRYSVYEYRPSISANATFLTLFGLALIIHVVLGLKWRTWAFLLAMFWGCVSEIIGYGGRIMLWQNPFSFTGFLMQIICITLGPTWFSAAIYLTLSKIVVYLGPEYSRFSPRFYYWVFIPCDIFSLCLQATGGALSTLSSGGSKVAVDIAIAGLSFQVFTLVVFVSLALEFGVRYSRAQRTRTDARKTPLPTSFKLFTGFLSLAVILILIRCVYRIDELSNGYNGPLIHDEGLFIGLEGVMIIVAVFCLVIAHPGPVFAEAESEGRIKTLGEPKTNLRSEPATV